MLHDDRSALALPCPVDFPSNIQAALGRLAGRVGLCAQIAPKARLLLSELVRCVNYKAPGESIRIKNSTLAAVLGMSVRSVGARKAELEEEGWIRRHQVKSRRRGMQVADVWLTPLALDALGLTGGGDRRGKSSPQARPMRRQSNADACLFPQPSTKGKLASPGSLNKVEGGTPLSPSEEEVLKKLQALYGDDLDGMEDEGDHRVPDRESGRVPKDLHALLTLGLSEAGIFKLMGMATNAKCRLGDILAVAGKAISKAKKVFCYVRKLVLSKKDWSRLAAAARGHVVTQNDHVGGEAGEGGSVDVNVLSAGEALELAPEAHEVLGSGCLVDKEEGRVWRVRSGLIEELPLSVVALELRAERGGQGVVPERLRRWFTDWRGDRFSKDRYERLARGLVRRHRHGELIWSTLDDAVALGARIAQEVDHLKAAAGAGKVVLNVSAGIAWRYQIGRLEQARLVACKTKTGPILQWAVQLSPEVEKKVARDLAEGRAVVVTEADAIGASRAESAVEIPKGDS